MKTSISNDEVKKKKPAKQIVPWALFGMSVFSFTDHMYFSKNPKVGAHHIWLCALICALCAAFSIWMIARFVRRLKNDSFDRFYLAVGMICYALLLRGWASDAIPYCKDIFVGSETVTTDSYRVAGDRLSFLDGDGNKVYLTIPHETARELSKEIYEYDKENNLLKYYDKITVTYFPNSKVIVSAYAHG